MFEHRASLQVRPGPWLVPGCMSGSMGRAGPASVEAAPRVQAQHSIRGVLPLSPASVVILHAMAPRPYTQTLRSPVQVRSVGDALGAPVLDLWTVLQQEPGWEALLEDGLHFTTAGQRAVRAALLRCIAERLPHLRCARLSPCFNPCFMYDLLHSSKPQAPVPAGARPSYPLHCVVFRSAPCTCSRARHQHRAAAPACAEIPVCRAETSRWRVRGSAQA
jgi:hypothetical protein